MKKTISILTLLCFLLSLTLTVSAEPLNWYVNRNKEHNQPTLDKNLSFIEKYNAFYVNKAYKNNKTEKVIYLTFDAGYENGNIECILNTLQEENVKATFFILENLIIKNPDLVLRMRNEGHLVANHSSTHINIAKEKDKNKIKNELEKLENLYFNLTAESMPKYFRPPEGCFDEESLKYINELGYKTVFWSFAYADWDENAQMSQEKAKAKILENVHNGEIMLLHPTSKTNALILKDIIGELRNQGYRFGTVDEI